MARYCITAHDGSVERYRVGLNLVDLDSVKAAAVSLATDAMREAGATIFDDDLHIEVTNASGLVLYSIIVVATDMVRPPN